MLSHKKRWLTSKNWTNQLEIFYGKFIFEHDFLFILEVFVITCFLYDPQNRPVTESLLVTLWHQNNLIMYYKNHSITNWIFMIIHCTASRIKEPPGRCSKQTCSNVLANWWRHKRSASGPNESAVGSCTCGGFDTFCTIPCSNTNSG